MPKCLLPVAGRPILEWQLRGLAAAGIQDVTLVTGFEAEAVEQAIPGIVQPGMTIRTVFNPFFAVSENIGSCFLIRDLLQAPDTVLLNGDTLFEAAVLQHLLAAPKAPVTVTIDRKPAYDADDMKVSVDGTRLKAIGKTLSPSETNGESIGMLLFRGHGGGMFAAGLEAALRQPDGIRRWYLSVIHGLAQTGVVQVTSIEGCKWGEVDYPADLANAETLVRSWPAAASALTPATAEGH
jgi:choline kinase